MSSPYELTVAIFDYASFIFLVWFFFLGYVSCALKDDCGPVALRFVHQHRTKVDRHCGCSLPQTLPRVLGYCAAALLIKLCECECGRWSTHSPNDPRMLLVNDLRKKPLHFSDYLDYFEKTSPHLRLPLFRFSHSSDSNTTLLQLQRCLARAQKSGLRSVWGNREPL